MTIENRVWNSRLENIEACAETAPAGAYERAKTIVALIHDFSNHVLAEMRGAGLRVNNNDKLRNLEVELYRYVVEANPDLGALIVAEGFGEAMSGPAVERVLANCNANLAALRRLGMLPAMT